MIQTKGHDNCIVSYEKLVSSQGIWITKRKKQGIKMPVDCSCDAIQISTGHNMCAKILLDGIIIVLMCAHNE